MEVSPFLTVSIPYLTAFFAGLFGGVHCIGMCGGVSGAMVYSIPEPQRRESGLIPFILNYNLGRIITYTLLGMLVGLFGSKGGDLVSGYSGWIWLRVVAGLLMIMMGLYLASWWKGLVLVERVGGRLIWERLKPISQRLLPVTKPAQAFQLGLVWGLLPCGLIYTMLVWSLASGGWWQGGAFLFAFGIGTLPVMLAVGLATDPVSRYLRNTRISAIAGIMVMLFGVWTIFSSLYGQINVGLGCLPAS